MNEGKHRVQTEAAPFARDEADTFATSLAQRDRRHGATPFQRHRVGIGILSHRPDPACFACPVRGSKRTDVGEQPVPEPDDQAGAAPGGDVAKDLPHIGRDLTSLVT